MILENMAQDIMKDPLKVKYQLDDAIDKRKNNAKLHELRALAHLALTNERNNTEKALLDINKAIEIKKGSLNVTIKLAILLSTFEPIKALATLKAINRNKADKYNDHLQYTDWYDIESFPMTGIHLDTLLENYPAIVPNSNTLKIIEGDLQFQIEAYKTAEKLFNETQDELNYHYHIRKGMCLEKLGDIKRAVIHQYDFIDPQDPVFVMIEPVIREYYDKTDNSLKLLELARKLEISKRQEVYA